MSEFSSVCFQLRQSELAEKMIDDFHAMCYNNMRMNALEYAYNIV